jgi:hypothetical protein
MDESEQINFIIDDYDDLFSDFDSRNYDRKSLSDDFLNECKKASLDKNYEGLELQILLPKKIRQEEKEEIIKGRLKSHFLKHNKMILNEKNKLIKEGWILLILGIIDLAFSTLAHYYFNNNNELILSLFYVIFDPLGILLLWEGIQKLISGPKKIMNELNFYKKMSNARIVFEELENDNINSKLI